MQHMPGSQNRHVVTQPGNRMLKSPTSDLVPAPQKAHFALQRLLKANV